MNWLRGKGGKVREQDDRGAGLQVVLKVEGMHCSSCGLLIDDELEEVPGVRSSVPTYERSARPSTSPTKTAWTMRHWSARSSGPATRPPSSREYGGRAGRACVPAGPAPGTRPNRGCNPGRSMVCPSMVCPATFLRISV